MSPFRGHRLALTAEGQLYLCEIEDAFPTNRALLDGRVDDAQLPVDALKFRSSSAIACVTDVLRVFTNHGRVVAGPFRQVAQFSQFALRRRLTRCVPIPSVRLPSSSRDVWCCTLAGSVLASDRWVHSPLFGDLLDVAASEHV
jgi:hypothetical protein